MNETDILIIGGGPAGMAAAISAKKAGVQNILIIERDSVLGGILNQCIHNGFGLHTFGEELTGPEYAERYADMVRELEIPTELQTMALDITPLENGRKQVTIISPTRGVQTLSAKAVVLAMGCRERPRGALGIAGFRPKGVYTAGTAQKLVNLEGVNVGKEVVILGSGDIGLIMARRMTLEGAHVAAVAELMPYSSGLKRNIVQCLDDYGIPLLLSHTVIDIKGKERLEGVVIAQVDENKVPIKETAKLYPCDTLLLSCGLIPENELTTGAGIQLDRRTNGALVNESLETSIEGVFSCGNVLHVHDLVDFVSEEASKAGESAARYVQNGKKDKGRSFEIKTGKGVRYTVPASIAPENADELTHIRFRVSDVFKNVAVVVRSGGTELIRKRSRILVPSEMVDLVIKKDKLQGINDDIEVYLEEV
ncbi:MAG: FAD-dependent oxidoreductase [Ruminococcus sp.]|nr:FAD-dependent oxidoreductase [Ruminococcus sp.]